MSDVRIEEVSDSDPSEGDISDLDDEYFDERDILRAKIPQKSASSFPKPTADLSTPYYVRTQEPSYHAKSQCIYPIYFDKLRSRRQGRLVAMKLAVENPMAREIVNVCCQLGLETSFEPNKCHPRDWANPGRVKVKLRGGNNPNIKNKHHLYILISHHLIANPTTTVTAKSWLDPGMPVPDPSKEYPTPAIPKGWKMSRILPYFSPALSDGGVNEDMFKQMMAQMQSAGGKPGSMADGIPNMAAFQEMLGGAPLTGNTVPTVEKKKKKPKKKT